MTRLACWILIVLVARRLRRGDGVSAARAATRWARHAGLLRVLGSERWAGRGGAGAYAALGWTPVAVTRPIQDRRHRGLLILAEPPSARLFGEESLSENDALSLLRWVEQGNTLLLMGRNNTALHQALKVRCQRRRQARRGGVSFRWSSARRAAIPKASRISASARVPPCERRAMLCRYGGWAINPAPYCCAARRAVS